jgi:hypothetical protein
MSDMSCNHNVGVRTVFCNTRLARSREVELDSCHVDSELLFFHDIFGGLVLSRWIDTKHQNTYLENVWRQVPDNVEGSLCEKGFSHC